MSGSSQNLALKAAEAELEKSVQSLQQALKAQLASLKRLRETGELSPRESAAALPLGLVEKSSDESWKVPASLTRCVRAKKKQGYLFKWMDRSIGWGGTKWALRFVSLDGGRISYFGTHTDNAPRYVLSLRGCAVRDEGWKRNRRHRSPATAKGEDPPLSEPGAYFFIFSIYQRAAPGDTSFSEKDDDEIVPLLRFSTPSSAEKLQWIELISEACAYSMTDEFLEDEAARAQEEQFQQRQQARMAMAMPEAKEGTLPPLYFATIPKMPRRRPSLNRLPDAKTFQSKSRDTDVDKAEARSTKSYPPSKPMHRSSAPSYLSVEAPAQNYRGFFNLAILLLVISNFRLIVSTIQTHGFVVTHYMEHWSDLRSIRRNPWRDTNAFVSGFTLQLAFLLTGFGIEWSLSRKRLHASIGMILHYMNAYCALGIPAFIVWHYIDSPAIGAALLLHATITWMKLVSYAAANEDYRLSCQTKEGIHALRATLALVEGLDPEDEKSIYPMNVTVKNIFYFWFAPTLTYQIAFPRTPRVRWLNVMSILLRMVLVFGVFTFLIAQVVNPALAGLISDLEVTGGTYTFQMMAEYWLKLSIANTYLWLLMFYFYFHLYLNFFAELLRFGDRVFYKDWWNSSEVSAYWRLWNCPVHYWLIRHLYFPCIRMKISRFAATFIVFFASAILHEVLVSVPFHMIRPWSFFGMMMQIPLVAITKYLYRRYPGTSIGNLIFWLSFCVVGQPMAVFLYAVDYQYVVTLWPLLGYNKYEQANLARTKGATERIDVNRRDTKPSSADSDSDHTNARWRGIKSFAIYVATLGGVSTIYRELNSYIMGPSPTVALMGTGMVLGMVHVLTGPDHLSALATLSANSPPLPALLLGVRWGVGHSTGLIIVGCIFIALTVNDDTSEVKIPHAVSKAFEALVGVFMLLLGAYGFRRALDRRPKFGDDTVSSGDLLDDDQYQEADVESESSVDASDRDIRVSGFEECASEGSHRSYIEEDIDGRTSDVASGAETGTADIDVDTNDAVSLLSEADMRSTGCCGRFVQKVSTGTMALLAGMIHGLAGPGGVLGVIPAVQLHDWKLATVYLGSFCICSTVTMGIFALIYGTLSSKIGVSGHRQFLIECMSAGLSVLIGILWLILLAMDKLDVVFP